MIERRGYLCCWMFLLPPLLCLARGVEAAEADFQREVYLVFQKYCFECHGPEEQRAGLRLDQRAAAREGGDSGPVWSKTAAESLLVQRLSLAPDDPDVMPPAGKPRPTVQQVEALAGWVDAGAVWPDGGPGTGQPSREATSQPVLAGRAHRLGFQQDVLPFLRYYCFGCHDSKAREAGFDIERYAGRDFEVELRSWNANWEKISRSIVSGSMPHPRQRRQPSQAERDLFGRWFEHELERRATPDTSRPTNARLRQLTAHEYDNTVRDLTGLQLRPSRIVHPGGLPSGGGFLNQGREMVLSPSRLMRYLQAADEIVQHASVSPAGGISWTAAAGQVRPARERPKDPGQRHGALRGHLLAFARRAYRRPLSDEETAALVALFDKSIAQGAGEQTACQQVLQGILAAPQFVYLAEDFQGDYRSIRWDDKDSRDKRADVTFPLTDHEVATRLSYFLWATMPDAELARLADAKKLHNLSVLEAQVRRMLADQRSASLATQFASSWLKLNKLTDHLDISRQRFPALTDSLRQAMYDEARMFLEEMFREDRSLLSLLDADFTYVNGELADLYGICVPESEGMHRVQLADDDPRGGLLGMAGFLSLTSHPDRRSGVERGAYILRELWGTPPLPPPVDAGQLENVEADRESFTMREMLELHRSHARCAGCHSQIDPLGLALDAYDAIGRDRRNPQTSAAAVDAVSTLPDGSTLDGLAGLKRYLLSGDRRRKFVKQFARQLMRYALTRDLESGDFYTLVQMQRALEANDYRPSAAIAVLVTSNVFLRRAEL